MLLTEIIYKIAIIYGCILLPMAFLYSICARKFLADFQARVGPSEVGLRGALQPLADTLKMFQKRRAQRHGVTWLWLILAFMVLLSTVAILPVGSSYLVVDTTCSALLLPLVGMVFGICVLMIGLSLHKTTSGIEGSRFALQAGVGAVPVLLALLPVASRAGGLSWSELMRIQDFTPETWTAFRGPFELLSLLVFFSGGLLSLSVRPFESEGLAMGIVGGELFFFKFARFFSLFLCSMSAVVVFLGGWAIPDSWHGGAQFIEPAVLLIKAALVMACLLWAASVIPRLRSEQVTRFSWYVLTPLALVAAIGATLWLAMGGP